MMASPLHTQTKIWKGRYYENEYMNILCHVYTNLFDKLYYHICIDKKLA